MITDVVRAELPGVAKTLEDRSAEDILRWAADRYAPKLTCASSLGIEDCVLIDMIARANLPVDLFTLDTELLFPETYALWRQIEARYGVTIRPVRPGHTVAEQAVHEGAELWLREPDHCCDLRKMQPLARTLSGFDAWITAIRREQSPARAGARKVEWDERHGLWKLNPIADWTEKDVWNRIQERELPYNPLHDQGYASIGCTHCTEPGAGREGRWSGDDKTECGLHAETPGSLT